MTTKQILSDLSEARKCLHRLEYDIKHQGSQCDTASMVSCCDEAAHALFLISRVYWDSTYRQARGISHREDKESNPPDLIPQEDKE